MWVTSKGITSTTSAEPIQELLGNPALLSMSMDVKPKFGVVYRVRFTSEEECLRVMGRDAKLSLDGHPVKLWRVSIFLHYIHGKYEF